MMQHIRPDRQKAQALRAMAQVTLERLKTTDTRKYPTNTLTDYYDIIHKLMEAISLEQGIKIKGEGAHQELIDYLAKEKTIDEQTRQLLQQMRDYRNHIAYEGLSIPVNYIILNEQKIKSIIKALIQNK